MVFTYYLRAVKYFVIKMFCVNVILDATIKNESTLGVIFISHYFETITFILFQLEACRFFAT